VANILNTQKINDVGIKLTVTYTVFQKRASCKTSIEILHWNENYSEKDGNHTTLQ